MKILRTLLVVLIAVGAVMWYRQHRANKTPPLPSHFPTQKTQGKTSSAKQIDTLTAEATVVAFVKANGKLPDCYITKNEARSKGWDAAAGNLCEVAPGKAIGGDVFFNRERALPYQPGRIWREADLNYRCGRRNADRLIFSGDGLIFVTHNHYRSFKQK